MAKLAGFKLETELVLVLDTGIGEELVLAADVAAGFPVGVPLGVDPRFW